MFRVSLVSCPKTENDDEGQYNTGMLQIGLKSYMFPWLIPLGAKLKSFLFIRDI